MKKFTITKTIKASNITDALRKEKDAEVDSIVEVKSYKPNMGFQSKDDDE